MRTRRNIINRMNMMGCCNAMCMHKDMDGLRVPSYLDS